MNSSNNLFRLVLPIEESKTKIAPTSPVLLMGSCFTQNIGEKFYQAGFSVAINPFGVVYNPISIASHIKRIINKCSYVASDVHERNGIFHTFDHHTSFSRNSVDEFLLNANSQLQIAADFLATAEFLFITLGTSFIYRYLKTGAIVANNHKYPDNEFCQELLEVDDIVQVYSGLIPLLQTRYPNLKLVFSISPIRHFRDGIQANTISKSTLSVAISKIQKRFSQVFYFPAFELVMDELRDYRFYAEDMIHINSLAIHYIWNRLQDSYFSAESFQMESECLKILSDLNHRPFNPNSETYRAFLQSIKLKIEQFNFKHQHRSSINLLELIDEKCKRLHNL